MTDPRAGQPAQPSDLVDVAPWSPRTTRSTRPGRPRAAGRVRYLRAPRLQLRRRVQRGAHPRHHPGDLRVPGAQGNDGPLFLGRDTHGLSEPAWATALEVFAANDVTVLVDAADRYTPTPAVCHAILAAQPRQDQSAWPTASSSPRRTTRRATAASSTTRRTAGPADTDATGVDRRPRQRRCSRAGLSGVRRVPLDQAPRRRRRRYDFLGTYVDDLPNVVDLDAIRAAGVRIGADPLGGATVDYWGAIAERHGLDLTVVNPSSTRPGGS